MSLFSVEIIIIQFGGQEAKLWPIQENGLWGNFDSTSPIILSYPFYTKWSLEKDTPNTILQYFLHGIYSHKSLDYT